MPRIGRGADWLGDASDASFLTHAALPQKTRDVKFASIATAADAREYARRFFHNAVDSAARSKKPATKARWALAARQYATAHDLAGQGGSLTDVRAGLNAADLNSASAIQADKGKPLVGARAWTPPAQDSPATAPSLPAAPPKSSPPVATAPPAPEDDDEPESPAAPAASSPRPAASSPASSAPATPVVPAAVERAPATVPKEWLVSSLLPAASSSVRLEAVKSLAAAQQYARRFFAGAVTHGKKASGAVQQRWAEAARIYVYAHRLAADPFIDRALDAIENDLRAADILSAQALAVEKGGQLSPLTVEWFTSPELARRGLATFKLTGSLALPGASSSSETPEPSSGTRPASLETPRGGLPRTFDSILNRFRGSIPLAFLRALIMAESSFNPNDENPESTARGLLQITPIVLQSWNNQHPADTVSSAQLFDPTINLKLGVGLVRSIVDSYNRNHPSMRQNFLQARYVEVLAEAWNVGYSEATGVGFILSALEREGTPSTLANVVEKGPLVVGLKATVATRITKRGTGFPIRVRQLYFDELARGGDAVGGGPQLLTAGIGEDAALLIFQGALLWGDKVFGG